MRSIRHFNAIDVHSAGSPVRLVDIGYGSDIPNIAPTTRRPLLASTSPS